MCDHCRGQPAPYTGIHYISFLSDLSFARACIGRRMAYMGGGGCMGVASTGHGLLHGGSGGGG